MELMFLEFTASALYDGGWRADDMFALQEEYDLTDEEVEAICKLLAEYEERSKNND